MAKIVKRNGSVYWIDSAGREVPSDYVPAQDKKRDALVEKLVAQARKLRTHIAKEKETMSRQIAKYLDSIAAEKGVDWEGATTLYNFDMSEAIAVRIYKRFTFDEKLNLAKAKIDECIKSWSPGSNEKIIALVNRAFRVDAKGVLNSREILGLRQLDFPDPAWIEAMELISQSMKLIETKTYYNFQEAGNDGKLITIVLSFPSL